MADETGEPTGPPPDIDLASIVAQATAEQASQTDSTTVSNISFTFCLKYQGRPWRSVVFAAPDADLAILTVNQIVNRLNEIAIANGFPPAFSAVIGDC